LRYIVAVLVSERPEATDCPHTAHAIVGIVLAAPIGGKKKSSEMLAQFGLWLRDQQE
jgi:hypothetical protein